jgi:leucine dehydrogenase
MSTKIKDLKVPGYERVVRGTNKDVGLDVIIAVHNTKLGPALGGCRFWNYTNTKEQKTDALRLAEGMTYKNSICGINHGGGKAVINASAVNGLKTPELYKALGEVVEMLGGIYYTAGDVGTDVKDLKYTKTMTEYVGGIEIDSSGPTATGLYNAIKSAYNFIYINDDKDFKDVHFAVSGVGKVGSKLVNKLYREGAKLTIADINQYAVDCLKFDGFGSPRETVESTSITDVHTTECNIFSPCALGNVINKSTRHLLNCDAIIGAANNQLDNEETDAWLFENNIVYVPDYLVNSGGVIAISAELNDTVDMIDTQLKEIGIRTTEVLTRSVDENIPTDKISREIAWDRINNT